MSHVLYFYMTEEQMTRLDLWREFIYTIILL